MGGVVAGDQQHGHIDRFEVDERLKGLGGRVCCTDRWHLICGAERCCWKEGLLRLQVTVVVDVAPPEYGMGDQSKAQ